MAGQDEITAIEIEKRLCAALRRQWSPAGMSVETLAGDAADEIERLRASLRAIAGNEYSGYGGIGGIARAALMEKRGER
jgi:16S rRNA A1518/A1519 N6-dimethyltransferase RsmA/KsgA/DIM1 with predicted DNA glycosylase/AP lyase activity